MITFQKIEKFSEVLSLWNDEIGFIYPLPEVIFKHRIIDYPEKIAIGAFDNGKLVGFIIGKTKATPLYNHLGWISLIYVKRNYRNRGIGSRLLLLLEEKFRDKEEIIVGKDYDNIFPGIPTDFDNLTDSFFEKHGYQGNYYTHDLINYSSTNFKLRNDAFYQLCNHDYREQLLSFLKKNFPGRWYEDACDYFDNGGTGSGYLIGIKNEQVISFARISDQSEPFFPYHLTWYKRFNNLGGIGPLGVAKQFRKKGYGYDLVASAINYLISQQIQEIMIDWTGLLAFYQQFGFEVWKSYKYMKKKP